MKPYFALPTPRVLAHRGYAVDAPENSLLAFARAMAHGAFYLETDVRASRDGVAVLSHDADLVRVSGQPQTVASLDVVRLRDIDLGHGQTIPTLGEALDAFPGARFNIDIKAADAIEPTIEAIRRAGAIDRVLVTSFSESRRRRAVAALPGVATSASSSRFAVALLAGKLRIGRALKRSLSGIDAVQVPERALGLDTVTPSMVRAMHALGLEVHVWTINDIGAMSRLLDAGVDGLVTDRTDVAVRLIAARRG